MKKNIQKKVLAKKTKPVLRRTAASPDDRNRKFFIAGIGASAGGLEALKLLFKNCPSDSGMAFVIIQHLDPTHKSLLTELIARQTKMKTVEVTDGMKVKPNCIYIIPPNRDLTISKGSLLLMMPSEVRSVRKPIDLFFHSLAADQKDKAIGIILSGTGAEGTAGLKDIKVVGGLTIVQEPQTAQFSGMPQSAVNAQTADYILPPEKIPDQLLQYIKAKAGIVAGAKINLTLPRENDLKKIFMIIRNQTGYDFSDYKTNTIARRIAKRIAINQVASMEDYILLLQKKPEEVEKLYKDFLIGVTSFFRDKTVFSSIEKKVIPYLFQQCREKQELRVWVCGCSTGEEAYSLAILFREALGENKQYIKVLIIASDIDLEAIEFARNGTYTERILTDVSADRIAKYFIRKNNGYQLKKEIREMVVFAHHNVIKDPPFSRMDLITCRNLLIYMNSDLQHKLIPLFNYSLNNEGILILGTSESIKDHSDLFTEFDSKNKILKKKLHIAARRSDMNFELPPMLSRNHFSASTPAADVPAKVNIAGVFEKYLLDNYAPPSVIIDKNNEVLYFSGNTGQYLEPPVGEAKFNIFKMARKGLKAPLEAAVKKVRIGRGEVYTTGVEVKYNGHYTPVNLLIKHVPTRDTNRGNLIVVFSPDDHSEKSIPGHAGKSRSKRKADTSDIEKELKITQEHLQAAINELDISKETLQSTNEEFQSSNEELQSTNEELETSREELQSVNEELITVNNELQDKIEQLSQANDDLNNLLSSIDVATVFLDRDLKIKRFTPTARKIFNLISSDIDRPVTHLSANIIYNALADDVKNALRTLAVKAADVQATDGTWYHMRIMPYRTAENIIEGVLVTFVEITELKNVEEVLKKTNEQLNLIMENLPAVPFTCEEGKEIHFTFVGKSSEKVTGFLPEQFIKNKDFWVKRIHPTDKKKVLSAFTAISKKGNLEHQFRWKCADGKYKSFINFLRYAVAENGRKAYIVGVWQEIVNSGLRKSVK